MKPNQYPIALAAIIATALAAARVSANPTGLTVQSGSAAAVANGNHLNVTASQNAFLTWQSFNIGAGQTTTFIQPSAQSIVWNQINDANPSQIFGTLNANGTVVLMNRSGFYFGPDSFVRAAGLIVSTAPLIPNESSAGLFWQFNGAPPSASILNYGQLNVGRGGSAFLIAEKIENHGSITAPEGNIGLFAGKDVLLSERPDGRGLSAQVTLPSGSVDNFGRLIADGGTIALNAQVVNQAGLIQANSVREKNGIIELLASDSISLGADSVIAANGDAGTVSAGGHVTIKADQTFSDAEGSLISVAGGGLGGNGGFVEVSAPEMAAIHSRIDGHAAAGSTGGQLLIDPLNITIGTSGSGSASSGTVNSGDAPAAGTLSLNVNSAFVGFSQIVLQALNNITLSSGVVWDLVASTGLSLPGSLLKLEAGNNITISSGASILAGENWSVILQAGRNFAAPNTVNSGVGNIVFSGTGSLQAQNGNISLLAGNNITVASGHVRTVGGGSITAQALGGTINTGTKVNGYVFTSTGSGYNVHSDLGGISTANGGDVSLTAGLDVISFLPLAGGAQSDAGSGAFGAAPGNVTLTAGRDISGHYVVRNGTGIITAGHNAGIGSRLLSLSLVSGGWTVNAVNDILLQEVRNPNGVFNNIGSSSSPNRFRFDYSADAYTILHGGNSVQLRGTALPRYADIFSQNLPPIYPGTLWITAGAGGVILGNDVILFPSPFGNLNITTTAGGGLVGTKSSGLTQLILSDSGKTQYRAAGDFGVADHADVPVHLNDDEPITLDIAGDLSGILLGAAKRAVVNVGGDMINGRFDGQNLRDTDVTSFNVVGSIINRNEFTSVTLNTVPNFNVFGLVYPALTGSASGIQNQFTYNATTKLLTFQGRMNGDQLQALLNLRVRTFDNNGFPIVDANGEPVTAPANFISPAAVQQLYASSQDVPTNPDTGYRLGGGGQFNFTAQNMDLGATIGIVSQGPRGNDALANYFTHGADINVNLSGNLEMFSTKIASLNGGDITVVAGGSATIGSREFTSKDQVARGIFTSAKSDVTLIAGGDININGSRIAAFDGGNVTVRSLNGNVDAGTGSGGGVTVENIYVNPVTRQILTYQPTIPGSGILATAFPPSLNPAFPKSVNAVGNILVETPNGDILASTGGIVQLPLNDNESLTSVVQLLAGYELRDSAGNRVDAAHMNEGTAVLVSENRNINASGSGVIGQNIILKASGEIKGNIFSVGNINLDSERITDLVALGKDVRASADSFGPTVTIIGTESVNAVGADPSQIFSQNANGGGSTFAQGTVANATSTAAAATTDADQAVKSSKAAEDGDLNKKNGQGGISLSQKVSRVTVVLPVGKKVSAVSTKEPKI